MNITTFRLFMQYNTIAWKCWETFRREFSQVGHPANVFRMALIIASMMGGSSFAAFVQVFGGPEYEPSTETGYLSESLPFFLPVGARVNNVGTAVGWATKYDAGTNLGNRGVLWSGSGAITMELGDLGVGNNGTTESRAYALNESGMAVGSARKYLSGSSLGNRAVRWSSDGNVIELGTLGTDNNGSSMSEAIAINSDGVAVGYATKYVGGINVGERAVRWDASGIAAIELDTLVPLGIQTRDRALAVNNDGTAVGYSGPTKRAVRWNSSGTAATELELPAFMIAFPATSEAFDVNQSGTAVGYASLVRPHSDVRALRWDGSGSAVTVLGDLGTSGGDTVSQAFALNDIGTAVGYAWKYVSNDYLGRRAVRWDGSGTIATELGHLGTDSTGSTETIALDVNNFGITVGYADKYIAQSLVGRIAIMWKTDTLAIDLNTLIDPTSGWKLREAYRISDTGWITGIGLFDPDGPNGHDPYSRLFLMQVTQIPEPSGLLLAAIAFACLFAFGNKQAVRRHLRG